jgi:WD40 repeat protein
MSKPDLQPTVDRINPSAEQNTPPGGLRDQLTLAPPCAPDEPASSLPAAEVPGYEILDKLGHGGMGVVYQARQMCLNRLVALKMILAGSHATAEMLARFKAEAESVARLQHPNIVQIYEVGTCEGKPYLSLEFVNGGGLDRKLAGRPQCPRAAAELLETLARAAHAAHQKGIVHRDLKPANVLLHHEGHSPPARGFGTPKITDFGLAKHLDGSGGQTQSGAIIGTPSYMAPEQAQAKRTVGPAADVYALGAILYEMLTGRPPFQAATPLDTVLQVMSEEPVPPSRRQPDVPPDLEIICLKCLQKDPGHRYASAEELAEDLRRFLDHEPIRARPVSRATRVRKWARRQPALATLLAVLAAGPVVSLIVLANFRASVRQHHQDIPWAVNRQGKFVQPIRRAYGLAFSPDGQSLAASDRSGTVTIRNAQTGEVTLTLRGHAQTVTSITFDRLGKHLASASNDGTAKVWDVASGKAVHTLRGHTGPVTGVAFGPDGQRLVSGSEDRTAKVWDVATGKELLTFRAHEGKIHCVTFSPDGRHVASGNSKILRAVAVGVVKVWEAESGKEVFGFSHAGPVWAVAFSGNGRSLATASADQTVKVWDADTGKLVLTFPGHAHAVNAVGFSPDDTRLVSASDANVKVWRAGDGQVVLTLHGHSDMIANAVFSPDGRRLASASIDGTVKIWDATDGRELCSK